MKTCSKCGVVKPLAEFYPHPTGKDKRQAVCKACHIEYTRARYKLNPEQKREAGRQYRKAHPDRQRATNLRRYGMTPGEFDAMLASQGGVCAACGTDEPHHVSGRFCVDHDHTTGKVRGILCHHCNALIGHAWDCVDVLLAAAEYLRRTL